MEITQENKDGIEVIQLEGNLVLAGVRETKGIVKDAIGDSSVDHIVLNMSGVPLMDSSGIGFLVASVKAATKSEKKLVLCECNDIITGIQKSSNLDDFLSSYATEDEALSDLE